MQEWTEDGRLIVRDEETGEIILTVEFVKQDRPEPATTDTLCSTSWCGSPLFRKSIVGMEGIANENAASFGRPK